MNICVVGATKGLGYYLVKKILTEGGHKVFAVALTASEQLSKLLEEYPNDLTVTYGDVTDESFVSSASALCKEALGSIDSLCNVAGVLLQDDRESSLLTCKMDTLRTTFEVNTLAPVCVIQQFYPIMNDGGTMFTVTSEGTSIKHVGAGFTCYAMSKTIANVISGIMSKTVSNVDFYSVHPGRMNTDMGKLTAQIEPDESADGFYALMTGAVELSRDVWYIDYKGKDMFAE